MIFMMFWLVLGLLVGYIAGTLITANEQIREEEERVRTYFKSLPLETQIKILRRGEEDEA